ncbi:hypothetical protein EUBSIR_01619 [[Eubacterium] siraeum DSM 15702]|uniref:Uncharacterized protein n=1 Tax=[Eubacterium] siraeum DSM 15702 TaxID=428128 RepID=B0MP61_9FIRM|nr:hypothetical protein EUBSIR_01619 [[Eubacterium] siraeum DSM 15702]
MSRNERLHSGGLGDDMKIPPGVIFRRYCLYKFKRSHIEAVAVQ